VPYRRCRLGRTAGASVTKRARAEVHFRTPFKPQRSTSVYNTGCRRSTLAPRFQKWLDPLDLVGRIGAPEGSRTPNPRIRSPMLCPVELRARAGVRNLANARAVSRPHRRRGSRTGAPIPVSASHGPWLLTDLGLSRFSLYEFEARSAMPWLGQDFRVALERGQILERLRSAKHPGHSRASSFQS
jgi:hypothetical protein